MPDKIRFRKIDESSIGDHMRLRPDDKCLFLYEYTSGVGFSGSVTNNLISNLKKKPSEQTTKGGWQYKGHAIRMRTLYNNGANVTVVKEALALLGEATGPVRLPGVPRLTSEERARLAQIVGNVSTKALAS